MNPYRPYPNSLISLFKSLYNHRNLILQMAKRDVMSRYKGSVMGVLWSLLNPLFLLFTYTIFFTVIFKSKWNVGAIENKSDFAILLFIGMIIHGLYAEPLLRAPGLIIGNLNLVKKVKFPLEILPCINLLASIFHCIISLVIIFLFCIISIGYLNWTTIFIPIILLPLLFLILGLAWGLSSMSVYVRDVAQPINLIITMSLFASPVFYPISAVPEYLRPWIMLNPITFIIEQARGIIFFGSLPDWFGLMIYTHVSLLFAWLGYFVFQKTRKGFSDVL